MKYTISGPEPELHELKIALYKTLEDKRDKTETEWDLFGDLVLDADVKNHLDAMATEAEAVGGATEAM